MSLQDDYFDLEVYLKKNKPMLKAFNRIWEAFCYMEAQENELLKIRECFRTMVELTFPPEIPKVK